MAKARLALTPRVTPTAWAVLVAGQCSRAAVGRARLHLGMLSCTPAHRALLAATLAPPLLALIGPR